MSSIKIKQKSKEPLLLYLVVYFNTRSTLLEIEAPCIFEHNAGKSF